MKKFALFALLFCASFAPAQDLTIKGDGVKVVTVVSSFPFTVSVPASNASTLYFWTTPTGMLSVDKGDSLDVTACPKGLVVVSVKSITANLDKDGKFIGFLTKLSTINISIGDVPGPTPPIPPVPPDPPAPPAPIVADGYRVIYLYESNDKLKYTRDQFNAMFGLANRVWLDANCAKEARIPSTAANPTAAAYWILEPTQDVSALPKYWGDAINAAKAQPGFSLPWIIISNGKTGFSGPLPPAFADIDALQKKYLPK